VQRYLVLNGPNLNLLGSRQPEIYGSTTLVDLENACRDWGDELGASIRTAQSNHEGELIEILHEARETADGVVFNPGAYTHTSYALHDAIEAIGIPTVEVHISNVQEREAWRKHSVVRPAVDYTIYGRGVDGYRWAMRYLHHRSEWPVETLKYDDHDEATIDVRRPVAAGQRPAVVLVHGGFWRHMWTSDTMDGLAVDLVRRGFITANVEYRRVGTGGGWPQTAEDVGRAIESVAEFEGVGPVAVVGHSAGGHLAFIAGSLVSTPYLPVSLAGVLDLEAAVADGIGDHAAAAFLSGADAASASPTRMAASGEALVFHGTEDDRVPISQARGYARANPEARLTELPAVGHFAFLERSDPAWLEVASAIEAHLGD
jgi:3-dehydroquinate dehydratase II